jgi:hypothetical protein
MTILSSNGCEPLLLFLPFLGSKKVAANWNPGKKCLDFGNHWPHEAMIMPIDGNAIN